MKKRILIGWLMTPQEHDWIGSTSDYTPTSEGEWYIPDGVLSGRITLKEAIRERQKRRVMGAGLTMGSLLGIPENVFFSLEDINPTTHQTIRDPKILGTLDPENKQIIPARDKVTGEIRDLTNEYISLFRERGLEEKLHLRPHSIREKEIFSGSEAMKDQ